jgi:hypothetical protein
VEAFFGAGVRCSFHFPFSLLAVFGFILSAARIRLGHQSDPIFICPVALKTVLSEGLAISTINSYTTGIFATTSLSTPSVPLPLTPKIDH